ncbi:MAG TPA: hypothetical protein DEB39_12705 [Planctomycetaceae bacterium]|nr:hypothetical protein [Planctomycetaceae bacterium]
MKTTNPTSALPPDETLMSTSELMAFLNLSRTKIWAMIQKENLPAFKFGGDYRFRKSEVLRWMERYRTDGSLHEIRNEADRENPEEQS